MKELLLSTNEHLAGRSYAHVYRVTGRGDLHAAISEAIAESGGQIIYASESTRAPFFFGVLTNRGERLGLLVYPFRITHTEIKNRPGDEIRGQIRFGSEDSWSARTHPIGRDISGVDTTILLGINPDEGYFIALDPLLWDPLPMGISFYAKEANIDSLGDAGWTVWEKDNRAGNRRTARSESGNETVIAFRPARFLDFARFERRASDLALDTPLRHRAAVDYQDAKKASQLVIPHALEKQFQLNSTQILEIISTRNRLSVAVRGGVAEYHLEDLLTADPSIAAVSSLDLDSKHDFDVRTKAGQTFRVECKNASPQKYKDGSFKVEVQKTRASQGDPASRYYKIDAFDVVAACLFSPTGDWTFRFALTANLTPHKEFPDRISPMQRIDSSWTDSISELA